LADKINSDDGTVSAALASVVTERDAIAHTKNNVFTNTCFMRYRIFVNSKLISLKIISKH